MILVARDLFLICSTAVQIVTICHITYQYNNHQQLLTYKRVRYFLLTLFTFSTILKYNSDKTQPSYSIFFSFLSCLVNGPSHETIKRKTFRSTNSGPLQVIYNGPTTEWPQKIKLVLHFLDSLLAP